MNNDFVVYILIHIDLVAKVCYKLDMQLVLLKKKKLIRDYDEKFARKTITHKILLSLTIDKHKKVSVFMLIVDIKHHEIILNKS